MHTSALEARALTDTTNEPQPEAPESETTALVPTESDIIEGEVIEIEPPESIEDHTPPKQKPYYLLVVFTILFCLIFLTGSLLAPLFTPSAIVTLIPIEHTLTIRAVIQVPGRALPPLTLMQSINAPATGNRHQDAARATGTITFYNGLLSGQTIAAGTILTGKDGVHVITDQAASIPAGNPPIYGQVTVSAHAVLAGSQENIPSYDINTACCATSVVAKNTQGFTGGASTRDFLVVSKADIDAAEAAMKTTLDKSEQAALGVQITTEETLTPPLCSEKVLADHQPGDEATAVTVTVSERCRGIAYAAHTVYKQALQMITAQATIKLGANYSLLGDIQVAIVHAMIIGNRQGQATIIAQITGTWAYQITPNIQQHLVHLVAGKSNQQAVSLLLSKPGIQGAQITTEGGNRTLPQEERDIHFIVVYRSA